MSGLASSVEEPDVAGNMTTHSEPLEPSLTFREVKTTSTIPAAKEHIIEVVVPLGNINRYHYCLKRTAVRYLPSLSVMVTLVVADSPTVATP